jgi:carbon-monoxide dehydrogenase medium subunit/2-furoyl-CoA dehydrogenase FAD binding subunit
MKAAPFEYVRAHDLPHALALLAEHGSEAKLVAGGQSLVPMMAMRLARPAVLVDINRLAELKGLHIEAGQVRMGATLRQREAEDDAALHAALPLVRDALHWVGHVQTRNRGTVGGSLVHADPSAELPLAALMLGASLQLRSRDGGDRTVAAADFFFGPMFTAVADTECLLAIDWPVWAGPGVRTAFEETAMRQGDFAMASAACQLQLDESGVCRRAALGLGGMDGTPRAFPELAAQLVGQRIDAGVARDVAQAAVEQTQPGSDIHADADYRRELGAVLLSRVLRQAAAPAH